MLSNNVILGISFICSSSLRWLLHTVLGDSLERRVELSNVFSSIWQIREADTLLKTGLSPYIGSAVHAPPLLIKALQQACTSLDMVPLPFMIADAVSALLLLGVARHLVLKSKVSPPMAASTISVLFLWNPCTILSSAAGSTATITTTCVLAALYTATVRRPWLAALACAVAAYMDITSLLYVLPTALVIYSGVESVFEAQNSTHQRHEIPPVDASIKGGRVNQGKPAIDARHHTQNILEPGDDSDMQSLDEAAVPKCKGPVVAFFAWFLVFLCTLVVASEAVVMTWPQGKCLVWVDSEWMRQWALDNVPFGISPLVEAVSSTKQHVCAALEQWVGFCTNYEQRQPRLKYARLSPQLVEDEAGQSWIHRTYGAMLVFEDLTPNLGLWWYFIVEMFQEFRTFFKFVLYSQMIIFSVPIITRFYNRPLFVFFLHTMMAAIFKPYPVVADTALYLSLVPLLMCTLEWAQPGVLLGFLMTLAAVMGQATLYQWLYTASANSNFYYAFTMVWGGSQVVLMLLITHAVVLKDRELLGKPLRFYVGKDSVTS